MTGAPSFTPLHLQVANAIRGQIVAGVWAQRLPGERVLAAELHVSRKTLRRALAHLRGEGVVCAASAQGHAIVPSAASRRPRGGRDAQVVFLSPRPLEQMRPFTVLWVDQLRSLLAERGVQFRVMAGPGCFGAQARAHLRRLSTQQPADCWLVAGSTEAAQRWFHETGTPCVLAGSCHAGIDLPNVDLDHAALGRHAAGVLLAAGHRRIALLVERAARAGDAQTQAGFLHGLQLTRGRDVKCAVTTLPEEPAGIEAAVRRLLARDAAPTALFIARARDYLSVVCALGRLRLRVADDVSLLLRDDEPFLQALLPPPNRYAFSPQVFARRMNRLVADVLAKDPPAPRHVSVLPTYVPGGSVRALR
ncbi:MAG: substrate-binding domain-containing protein [Opitutaceae bacterium]|nr:substrate-binding domain-containing protein [Opitutaceae bacterium]